MADLFDKLFSFKNHRLRESGFPSQVGIASIFNFISNCGSVVVLVVLVVIASAPEFSNGLWQGTRGTCGFHGGLFPPSSPLSSPSESLGPGAPPGGFLLICVTVGVVGVGLLITTRPV